MKKARSVVFVAGAALFAILTLIFLVLSFQNSLVVSAVSIKLKPGETEIMDPVVLGVGKGHELPDYRIKLRVTDRYFNVDLGTKLDTSAKTWLDFPVQEQLPYRQIQEILVLEDDVVTYRTLDRIQPIGESGQSTHFEWRMITSRSLEMGIRWFLNTNAGIAVLITAVLAATSAAAAAVREMMRPQAKAV